MAAILLIVAFQVYWLNRLYKEEHFRLEKETGNVFRDVIYNLQVEKIKSDTVFYRKTIGPNIFMYNTVNAFRRERMRENQKKKEIAASLDSIFRKKAGMMMFMKNKAKDSLVMIKRADSMAPKHFPFPARVEIRPHKTIQDIDTALINRLSVSGMNIVVKISGKKTDTAGDIKKDIFGKIPAAVSAVLKKRDTDAISDQPISIKSDVHFPEKSFVQMITTGKAMDDSLPAKKIDSAYSKELGRAGILLPFVIRKTKDDTTHRKTKDSASSIGFHTPPVPVGFNHAYWYHAEFGSPGKYILGKIFPQILFSFFLVAFISLAFIFLYRNLLAQKKLTAIKNDFIGNITHELKTPIATVNVAIEALRNFGGLDNPERTREYLDISASELQRLGLLVDKVLKLSMFEKQEIALQKESFNLLQLIEEVTASMKLQFEKQKAIVNIDTNGDNFMIDADRMHISSVIYNLLDNALKYSKENPVILVKLIRHNEYFEFSVKDNGMGIPDAYLSKIFDQFFRVPSGNRHNTKGYGLGLSYVNHIVKQHNGFIEVESEQGKGSTFIVKIPFQDSDRFRFNRG